MVAGTALKHLVLPATIWPFENSWPPLKSLTAACLLNKECAGCHVPLGKTELPERIETTRCDVGVSRLAAPARRRPEV